MKPVVLCVAAVLLSATGLGYAAVAVTPPQSQDLTNLQSKLQEANQNIEQIKLKREKLLAQLQGLEKKVGITASSLRELRLQMAGKEQRLKHVSQEMQKQQASLALQNAELAKQVKAAFVMGKKEQLRLLLNQQNPALASRMLVYYNYLNKNRLQKLATLKDSIARLKRLEQEKRLETGSLAQVVTQHKTAQQDLKQSKQQREQLLISLKQEFKRQLGELAGDEKEAQVLIDRLEKAVAEQEKQLVLNPGSKQVAGNLDIDGNPITLSVPAVNDASFDTGLKKSFSKSKGHLPWPVKGSVIKKFGSPRSETRWDGVLISAREGTDIRAVSSGQVVFADWLKGYGWLIIINHGDGYMSLYAFNQTVYKKVGEQVKAGAIIAAVGSSGGRAESGLYFGIRNNGKPVNPALWCKKG